jgi:predicted kinase
MNRRLKASSMSADATLLMMAGLPGTGKSTLALEVGKVLGWPVIDKDVFKSTLLEGGLPEATAASLAYELSENLLVRQRHSVILDTPLTYKGTLGRAQEFAGSINAALRVVFCHCDADIRDWRMNRRSGKVSQPKGLKDPGGNPDVSFSHLPDGTLRVDTSQPVDTLVKQVLTHLQSS